MGISLGIRQPNGSCKDNGIHAVKSVNVVNGRHNMNGTTNRVKGEPPYGRRLLLTIIDDLARTEPGREWVSVPVSNDPKDGWQIITFAQAAKAINRVAHEIIQTAGSASSNQFPTIAYVGPNDVRYVIFALGAVKSHHQALFVSPRNSTNCQLSLFTATDCRTLYFDASCFNMIQPWLRGREMRAVKVDSIEQWTAEGEVKPFPYSKTFEEAEWDPLCVLHTSGSTGVPKPIVVKQGMLAIADSHRLLPDYHGKKPWICEMANKSKRLLNPAPLFHAMGLYTSLMLSVYYTRPVAFGVDRPLTADLIVETLENVHVESIILPPILLEEMSREREYLAALRKMNFVSFGGGHLARDAGNRLIKQGVILNNVIACTEAAPYCLYWNENPDLWNYFTFNSELCGIEWRQQTAVDHVYEQVMVRKDKNPGLQGHFYTFPERDEVGTNDLFEPHPTEPDTWTYQGRADNTIVFSNGEKLNPVIIEQIVGDHPKLTGALVVGSNRNQPAIILEAVERPRNEMVARALLDQVWLLIERANKETVAHGRIGREFVALSDPNKPFPRAGKGTIQRGLAVKLYEDEIDRLYREADKSVPLEKAILKFDSQESLIEAIATLFQHKLHIPKLEAKRDFFAAGLDSIQVIAVSKMLRAELEAAGFQDKSAAVATRAIYNNPTAKRLAEYIWAALKGCEMPKTKSGTDYDTMQSLLDLFTRDMSAALKDKPAPADDGQVVLITGTTGGLGSYLLDIASRAPNVKKVICLNRSEHGKARQIHMSGDRGLSMTFENKAEFLQADLSRPDLGLDRPTFEYLLREVDRVIHNQWPVNFNMPIETFEPHIRGVRHLADFSAAAAKRVPIIFTSSIGTLDSWNKADAIPERSIRDLTLSTTGYGRSKLISSLVLEKATEVMGVPTAIVRVGQVAGPESATGYWNRHEWLPTLVASSVHLGILPNHLGHMSVVDWVPIESEARMLLEVSGVLQKVAIEEIRGYFHGVNPETTQWSVLAPVVREYYDGRIKTLVDLEDWVDALQKSEATTEDASKNPAVKLLDTYRAMARAEKAQQPYARFETTRTKQWSKTLRDLKAVTPDMMRNWCRQWNF